jgi:hypothetical protein
MTLRWVGKGAYMMLVGDTWLGWTCDVMETNVGLTGAQV